MKLCKQISHSLTSAANQRARGATMFLRRRQKASKWVHEGGSQYGGVIPGLPAPREEVHEIGSELAWDDGQGAKPLFYFKIPNLKQQAESPGHPAKMALTQSQFEQLRLSAKKCDHRGVAPDVSFDIAHDLQAHKGRGGRLFEKRRTRSEKFVVEDPGVAHALNHARLEAALDAPVAQKATPWDAAAGNQGNVAPAFDHLTEMERNQKLSQFMKITKPKTPIPPQYSPTFTPPNAPTPTMMSNVPSRSITPTNLKGESLSLLQGKNFNRAARGWQGGGEYPVGEANFFFLMLNV